MFERCLPRLPSYKQPVVSTAGTRTANDQALERACAEHVKKFQQLNERNLPCLPRHACLLEARY
jgi:hypothetical protein